MLPLILATATIAAAAAIKATTAICSYLWDNGKINNLVCCFNHLLRISIFSCSRFGLPLLPKDTLLPQRYFSWCIKTFQGWEKRNLESNIAFHALEIFHPGVSKSFLGHQKMGGMGGMEENGGTWVKMGGNGGK